MATSRSEAGKLGWKASEESRNERYRIMREKYQKSPNHCSSCGNPLDWNHRRNKFCSHSCSAIINNIGRRTHRAHTCKNCGKPIPYNRMWCCHDCQMIYTAREKIKNGTIGHIGLRGYLLRTRPHTCARCTLTEWMGQPITLESHHKDGNHYNNEETNLELLCPNCHAITGNYKAKNKGHGRDKRRIRSGMSDCARPVTGS